jgi:hypothetical protein
MLKGKKKGYGSVGGVSHRNKPGDALKKQAEAA